MADTVTPSETAQSPAKLSFPTMTAMVVGGMVGAGVFSLPRRFAQETGVLGALIAWLIAGIGMLMLAFVFQTLATLPGLVALFAGWISLSGAST